jgi:antirestriction protein ArdC
VREDHAGYIGSWLKALRHNKGLIFSAAAHAQRAVDYLHGLQSRDAIEAGGVAAEARTA